MNTHSWWHPFIRFHLPAPPIQLILRREPLRVWPHRAVAAHHRWRSLWIESGQLQGIYPCFSAFLFHLKKIFNGTSHWKFMIPLYPQKMDAGSTHGPHPTGVDKGIYLVSGVFFNSSLFRHSPL